VRFGLTMQCLMTVFLLLVSAVVAEGQTSPKAGETLEECVARKRADKEDRKTEEVIRDRGCTTGSVPANGSRKSCSADVCWTAPPGRVIVSAHAVEHSGTGDRHDFSGPRYVPDRERSFGVCFHVSAKSKGGMSRIGVRGWEKINVTVTHKQVFSPEQILDLVRECQGEGAG